MADQHPPGAEETVRLWPDAEHGPYELTIRWGRKAGRPHPVGMSLLLRNPDDERWLTLTTSSLRDLKLREIADEDREQLERRPPARPSQVEALAGMRPATERKLRRAAGIYQAAWEKGENPTQAVEYEMTLSYAAAANLVRRARAAGFLPETEKGKPGA